MRILIYLSNLARHNTKIQEYDQEMPGWVAQSEKCLTADSGVRLVVEIDHEIFSPASADPWRVDVSYKRKCVPEVLVKRLVKLAQEKKFG